MSENESPNPEHGIYLDNAATSEVDPRVVDAMLPFFTGYYGNASSFHQFGTRSKEILDNSRETIAECIGAKPGEIFFTSSGTEANNWALKGIAWAHRHRGNHLIVSSIEHDCILNTCRWLSGLGFSITYLPVDSFGMIDLQELERSILPQTILVSVMHANNEIGTIQPIAKIGRICHDHGILFHSDCCQSFGKIPLNVRRNNVDLITLNAHKIYGPKGTGALYIREGISIVPLLHGGGQEKGLRSSTENLPSIVGFAKASSLCMDEMTTEIKRLTELRKKIEQSVFSIYEQSYLNGHPDLRLPGLLNFGIHGLEGETIRLLLLLDSFGIAVSTGSACSSNDPSHNGSHVLQSIGLNAFQARGSIRISLGRFTTARDIEIFNISLHNALAELTSIFS